MNGQVLNFDIAANSGVITGANGNRYNFTGADWMDANNPARGMGVDFDTDLDQAFEIVRTVGQEIAEDPEWAHLVRAAPRPHRVNAFTPNGIDIRIVGETAPDWQWAIMGQIRLRLKKAFDAAGIELAYPRTKVFVANTPDRQAPPTNQE